MSLAQRVRDLRYAKGWGTDELASRASISRTALYQLESGRTEHPRAATVRRIAEALEISIEELLAPDLDFSMTLGWPAPSLPDRDRDRSASNAAPAAPALLDPEPEPPTVRVRFDAMSMFRERDLDRKFREVLASPLGEGLARILEESHRLLPRGYVEMNY